MNITVWSENVHEKEMPEILEIYPKGIHGVIAEIVQELEGAKVHIGTLDDEDLGLSDEVLKNTDVLLWWGHAAHDRVPDSIVDKIQARVLDGMGLIVLHSGHKSKILMRMLGTSCDLRWRDNTYERIFCVNPTHPIAKGIPANFELGIEECYGEFFDIAKPDELIFIGWHDIGEVFRSGCTWSRGYGKIFYFQPGHETNESFKNCYVRKIIQNGCIWAAQDGKRTTEGCPHIDQTLEEIRLLCK